MRQSTYLCVAAALVCTVLVGSADAAPLGTIAEFPVAAGSAPFRIASGADGNLWYSDQASTAKAIGRITTDGAYMPAYALPSSSIPRQVRVGPDGDLWFTDTSATAPAIGRIALDGTIIEFGLPARSVPNALAIGADGNVWFTDRSVTSPAIGRITPAGSITEFSAGLSPGSLPNGITPGPDGSLWFTDQGATRAVGRATTAGVITEYANGLNAGSLPAALTAGPDGRIWFTDQGTTKAIGRVTSDGGIVESAGGLNPGSNPIEVTPGADGNLWFTDRGATKAIGRISPDGAGWTITNFPLAATTLPGGVRTGSDGNIWFVDNGSPQAIGRFDTNTPAASTAPPVLSGRGAQGARESCGGDTWSDWAGRQPSHDAFAFDGYTWLLDGSPIRGATGPSYTPTASDSGHGLTCRVTVTYTLFPVTVSAASASVRVEAPAEVLADLGRAVVGVGPGKSLATKLQSAATDLDRGDVTGLCTVLADFTHELAAQTGKSVAPENAGRLLADAALVESNAGCEPASEREVQR